MDIRVPRQSLTRQVGFKRWKTLAKLGQLPKHDEVGSRPWLHGKRLLARLTQQLIRIGRSIPLGQLPRPKG